MSVGAITKQRFRTMEEVLQSLGGIPPSRIRMDPVPGTARIRDLLRHWRSDGRMCELVDGTLVEKPSGFLESNIAGLISTALNTFIAPRDLGIVVGEQGMMRLRPGLVRAPDVSFISWDQIPGRQISDDPIPSVYPELAVEVFSKGNTRREMARKRKEYFRVGARIVWMVYPRKRSVDVYTAEDQFDTLAETDTLDGGEVLPGFKLPVRSLFVNTPPARPKKRR